MLVLAPLAALAVVEAGLRIQAYHRNRTTLGAAFSVIPEHSSEERVRFRDIIRPSGNDKIVYELRPNLDVVFKDGHVTTDSHGFRGREVADEVDPRTITIVGLGGSHMFGHGVSDEDLYTLHLEALLRERHPERPWRVINTAAPSYGAVTKVEVLKEKGLAYRPDLVLLHVDRNNLDLPNYVRIDEDPFDFGHSFLLGAWHEIQNRKREGAKRYAELATVDKSQLEWSTMLAPDPSKIPERYRGLVGWEPYYTAMDELAQLSEERGFEVLTYAYLDLDINPELLSQAARRGLETACFRDRIDAHLAKLYDGQGFSVERYIASDLVVSTANLHPSPLLHRMTAEWLFAELESRGMLERVLARRGAER